MDKFNVGDFVYAGDYIYGEITHIEDNGAYVEFSTAGGGGSFFFEWDEMRLAEKPVRTNYMFDKLKPHIGHNIVCVYYGDKDNPADICIECEDCCEVLVSAETYDLEED